MKKVLISTFKVLFWAYFVYCTGIVQGIVSLERNPPDDPFSDKIVEKDIPGEDRFSLEGKMNRLYYQKIDSAEAKVKKGGVYSPYDYFTDMKEIDDFRREYGIKAYPMYFELQQYMRKSLYSDMYTQEDLEKARDIAFPGSYAQTLERKKNPTTWKDISSGVGRWSLALYLKMLPFVFFLFLIWVYEENNRKSVRVRNPFSFIISLIFHPIVIFLAIRQWWGERGRSMYASVEARRIKKSAFALFTEDEVALISQFSKKHIDIKEFRSRIGADKAIPQRSFMIAFLITVLMYCAPSAQAVSSLSKDKRTTIYQVTNSYHYFSYHSETLNALEWHAEWIQEAGPPEEALTSLITILFTCYRRVISYLLSRGYIRCIEHVPLMVHSYLTEIKSFVNIKNCKYEKDIMDAYPYRPFFSRI